MTFTPVLINADGPAIEDERIPVLTITKNGEDTVYTIPKEISGATAIEALEVYVLRGEPATALWLAQHALGKEGMDAVLTCEQMTLKQAQQLIGAIGEHYIGTVKDLGKAQE